MDAATGTPPPRPDDTADPNGARHPLWTELAELAAVFTAGAAAHTLVLLLGHSSAGALAAVGITIVLTVVATRCWRHRRRRALHHVSPRADHRAAHGDPDSAGPRQIWRLRVEVGDQPGGLARLAGELARTGVDIRTVQVHPAGEEVTDELLVLSPSHVGPHLLRGAVRKAGGSTRALQSATPHDLTDDTSDTLRLVGRVLDGTSTLPQALARLLRATEVRDEEHAPAHMAGEGNGGATLCLRGADGGHLVARRPDLPFTPLEFARAQSFVDVLSRATGAGPPLAGSDACRTS